jgi:ketosteroid isomerase-like protein
MSQENVDLARAALNAFAEMDEGLVGLERVWEFMAEDVLATFSGFGFVDEQTFRGLEFLDFRASWMEPYDDWMYEPREILDAGGSQVVVLLHQRGRPHDSDSWVEMDYGMVYTFEGGLIRRSDFYATPEQALAAAGLSE